MEDASLRRVLLVGCRKKATTHEVRKGEFEKSTQTHLPVLLGSACASGERTVFRDVSFDAHLVGGFPSEEYFEGTPVNILCICIGGLGFKDFFIFTPNP